MCMDSTQVEVLLNGHTCENVLADKAYDSDAIRNYVRGYGGKSSHSGEKEQG